MTEQVPDDVVQLAAEAVRHTLQAGDETVTVREWCDPAADPITDLTTAIDKLRAQGTTVQRPDLRIIEDPDAE